MDNPAPPSIPTSLPTDIKLSIFNKTGQNLLSPKGIFISVTLLVLVAVISFLFSLRNKNNPPIKAAPISGTIDLNGHIPPGSSITIAAKEAGASQYNIVVNGLNPADQATWQWDKAKPGTLYEMKAYLTSDGKTISESDSKLFAAPAFGEVLTINSKAAPTTPAKTKISGYINLNGYIPPGSYIVISQRQVGDAQFTPIVSDTPAADGTKWIWNDATDGTLYEIEASLKQGDITIAEGVLKRVPAPAANEELIINSVVITPSASPTPSLQPTVNLSLTPYFTSTPSPANVIISGSIDLNGTFPSGALIAISVRKKGEVQFSTVIDGITAADKASWSWNNAQTGVYYEIKASLKINGNVIKESQTILIAAPAANEVLTINAGTNLSQPPMSPGIACNQANSSNNWNVNISYHSIDGTKQYWIKVGDINQDNRFLDTRIPPNNQSLPTTYNFNTDYFFSQGVTYFAKYAYSTCNNCSDAFYFSPFSAPAQFSCNPPGPTNTPSPTPTITPTPKPTKTPTPSPSPTITVEPSSTPTPPLLPTETPMPTDTPPPVPTN